MRSKRQTWRWRFPLPRWPHERRARRGCDGPDCSRGAEHQQTGARRRRRRARQLPSLVRQGARARRILDHDRPWRARPRSSAPQGVARPPPFGRWPVSNSSTRVGCWWAVTTSPTRRPTVAISGSTAVPPAPGTRPPPAPPPAAPPPGGTAGAGTAGAGGTPTGRGTASGPGTWPDPPGQPRDQGQAQPGRQAPSPAASSPAASGSQPAASPCGPSAAAAPVPRGPSRRVTVVPAIPSRRPISRSLTPAARHCRARSSGPPSSSGGRPGPAASPAPASHPAAPPRAASIRTVTTGRQRDPLPAEPGQPHRRDREVPHHHVRLGVLRQHRRADHHQAPPGGPLQCRPQGSGMPSSIARVTARMPRTLPLI